MNKKVFSKTLSGHRKLNLDILNFAQSGQLQVEETFPTTEKVVVADVSTTPPSTQYKSLTPAMVGLENLTAGTNINYNVGTTYNGTAPITINSTDTTYSAGDGIEITGTTIKAKPDEDTIDFDGDEFEVVKVPNNLTAGTNITYSVGATYNGSAPITINATDTDTTYSAGDGIEIVGTTIKALPDENTIDFNSNELEVQKVPQDLTINGTAFNGSIARTYNLAQADVAGTIILNDVYDPAVLDSDSLTTSFATIFSGNLSNSFVAKTTSVLVDLSIFHRASSSNRYIYVQLADYYGTEWSVGMANGGYGTGTRDTNRILHYADETDRQYMTMKWYLQGLTIGNTYWLLPQAKTSATFNYIYAGGSYPACILTITNL